MDHFNYRDGRLLAEDVPVADIAAAVGTPFYCYSAATLTRHFNVFADAVSGLDALICYAVKANSNLAVLKTLARLGSGADVVSSGELTRALRAGIPADKIVYSGVGKTDEEIAGALDAGIFQINVESEPELARLAETARALGRTARAAIRVNPGIDAGTHDKISTGRKEDKFGIDWPAARALFENAARYEGVRLAGLAVHIGSQLTRLEPFENAFRQLVGYVGELREAGHAIETIDFGGGLGIPYMDADMPGPDEYGALVTRLAAGLGCRVIFEPGRMIAGNAGILVARVIHVKSGTARKFVILDAAMNDLLRPALYDARHQILPVNEPEAGLAREKVDIVGPVCETGDRFATEYDFPAVYPNDLVFLRTAGAYGAVMASAYNSRDLIPEVLVNGGEYAVVKDKIDIEAMLAFENLPNWLQD